MSITMPLTAAPSVSDRADLAAALPAPVLAAAPGLELDGRQPELPQAQTMHGASVMMIDDEPMLIELVRAFLDDAGYTEFRGESDPVVGLERLRADPPDLLLLDLMMPGLSGFEVLRQVRAAPMLQMMPVIVMTSASDSRVKLRVLELGATDFLEKPVDPSELVLRLRNTLAFKAYRERSAWFDVLTGLPNRRFMVTQTASMLRRALRDGGICALLKVEIGRIRQVTETLGHRAANEAVRTIAQRIQDSVRAGDAVARLGDDSGKAVVSRTGADEFAILLPGLRRVEDAAAVARRLLAVTGESMLLDGHDWFPTVSIGIAGAPDDAAEPEALMHCARVAASAARDKGGSGYGFYSAGLNAAALERLTLEAQLRRALQRGEFELHYQPKVTLATGAIIGCEALIRWRHPTRGLVPPGVFITVAEEASLIVDIGSWVLGEACRAARRWFDAGLDCRVAVNVATPHFLDGRLVEDVRRALGATGLAADRLTTELTESMLMGSAEDSLVALVQLKALGVSISLDDFGTGYSSLAYLKRMPLDELKIDRSFVSGLPDDTGDLAIVRAIIAMAHSLGLKVVAEGVETAEQAACLQTAGCESSQGWLFGRPLPEDEFVALLGQDRLAHPR